MVVNALSFTKGTVPPPHPQRMSLKPTEKESQGLDSGKKSPWINFKR